MSKIGIGIPAYGTFEPEVAFDYMRMCYSFGRRYQDHEFFLIGKFKSEQFRARNSIVQTALQFGLDYLLFLDDDHIINWKEIPDSSSYDFLSELLRHKKDIVGALYYHRTGQYKPVLMKETDAGGYTFLNDAEITGGLQQVDVQGGGCMLIDLKIFDKIKPPYFEPEMQTDGANLGTDIQLCRKAKEAGFEVWCDTGIVIGHMMREKKIVIKQNRDSLIADNAMRQGIGEQWMLDNFLSDYKADVREYTGLTDEEIIERAVQYQQSHENNYHDFNDPEDYYRNIGIDQICRNMFYHSQKGVLFDGIVILKQFRTGFKSHGLDFGCGTAPIGYELLKKGHRMDFVDIDGAASYEFLKWRVNKNGEEKAGFSIAGPYDFVLLLDIIEHLPVKDWKSILDNIIGRMKEKGVLITNFMQNNDYSNKEHVFMDKDAVAEFFVSRNLVPKSESIWFKDDNYMGGVMATDHTQEKAA